MTSTASCWGGVRLGARVFAPNVKHKNASDESQAHDENGDGATVLEGHKIEVRSYWISKRKHGHLHFDSGRVVSVESPHSTAGLSTSGSGSSTG